VLFVLEYRVSERRINDKEGERKMERMMETKRNIIILFFNKRERNYWNLNTMHRQY
jgi:ribosomal silencing factor RsfS